MSCFILEIRLPHLFRVVINLSDFPFFKNFVLIFYKGRAALFFRFTLPHGHVLLAAVRVGELGGEKEQREGRVKEKGRQQRRMELEREKRGQAPWLCLAAARPNHVQCRM